MDSVSTFSPDQATPYWQWDAFELGPTIVFTWIVMAALVIGSWLITRKLSDGKEISRWQCALEAIVQFNSLPARGTTDEAPWSASNQAYKHHAQRESYHRESSRRRGSSEDLT